MSYLSALSSPSFSFITAAFEPMCENRKSMSLFIYGLDGYAVAMLSSA